MRRIGSAVTTGSATVDGVWDERWTKAGDIDEVIERPIACYGGLGVNPSWVLPVVSSSETGSQEENEVHVSRLTGTGLVLVARSYYDAVLREDRFRRTVVAPDGNTLELTSAVRPLDVRTMNPDGIAWNPATGQIVWYPNQEVGFV